MTLPLADELPLQVLPPGWSENYCLHGYDYTNNVGFWIHMGTWPLDTSIWRETLIVFLPEARAAVYRGYARSDTSEGPRGSLLSLKCLTVADRWQIFYSGPARVVSAGELFESPLAEKPSDRLDLDIEFNALSPIWDFTQGETRSFRHHYEQMIAVRGKIGIGGTQFEVTGHGYRDHSRGPRNLSDWLQHTWIHGQFEDGTGFAVFQLWTTDPLGDDLKVLDNAVVLTDEGKFEPVRVVESPRLFSLSEGLTDYTLVLESPARRMEIRGSILNTVPVSFEGTTESYMFGNLGGIVPFVALEQPTVFSCAGVKGGGHTERSLKISR